MDKEKDILTKVIQDRLKNYEFQDTDSVWMSIERDLINSQKTSRLSVKRIAMLSAAAAVAILFCLNWFFIDKKTNESPDFTTSIIYPETQAVEEIVIPVIDTLYEQNNLIHKKKITVNAGEKIAGNNKEQQIAPDNYIEDTDEEKWEAQKDPKPQKKKTDVMPDLFANEPVFNASIRKKKTGKNLMFALSVGNSNTFSTDNAEGADYFAEPPRGGYGNIATDNTNNISVADIKYDMPVSAGFFVRKYVTDSWALESGLSYTYLSSTETLTENHPIFGVMRLIKRDIKLHYLGIPLKISYSFYDTGQLSLYSTAGGMGELCVYGKQSMENKSARLDVPEIQWSVFASLGLNYKLTNKLGLFVEPGIAYYFDDGSEINTIRKSRPFNVNLQAGLRLEY